MEFIVVKSATRCNHAAAALNDSEKKLLQHKNDRFKIEIWH